MIHPDAKIGKNVVIEGFSEIGPNAVIGDDCRIVSATVEGTIGARTKCWRYSHVMERAVLGEDCQVCNGAIVLSDAVIGNNVNIQVGACVGRLAVIGDDVFIGPNVVFCNSKNPTVETNHSELEEIVIKGGASIGANVCIMAGVVIYDGAVVGAGSVVTMDVMPFHTVYGVPAI